MMKTWMAVGFLCLTAHTAQGQPRDFLVVGYYPLRAALTADVETVPYDEMTHINLAFLNPDSLGNFTQDLSALVPFVEAAHRKGVKVLFSMAGGGRHPQYATLLQEEHRGALVKAFIDQVRKYNLDGIDVDLEGRDIDQNYEAFVVELARALREHGKLITAAVAVYFKDQMSDRALQQYDFVNIMVYDRTGPWRPAEVGPHSPYEAAVADLKYFNEDRGLPKEKLVLGVPFYGYWFESEQKYPVVSRTYGGIVSSFPGAEMVDEWRMPDGNMIYYNGIPTIRRKTKLAREKAAGVMIWQVLGDAPGEKSLLKTINAKP